MTTAELSDDGRRNTADPEIDGGDLPKNPGDRAFDRGQTITLDADPENALPAGEFVEFDGEGGFDVAEDITVNFDGVLKDEAASETGGKNPEKAAIHTYGVIRVPPAGEVDEALEDYDDVDGVGVIDEFDDGDVLVSLN